MISLWQHNNVYCILWKGIFVSCWLSNFIPICLYTGTEFILFGAEKEIIKYYPKENRLQDFVKNEVLIEGIDYHFTQGE